MDAIGLQIAWNRLVGVADEAGAALRKTSFSTIVRESNDFSCAILDLKGDLLVQGTVSVPAFVNSLQNALQHLLPTRPPQDWQAGDAMVTNDPWVASGDLHDMHIYSPIFFQGKIVAFAGTVAHWPDVGGRVWSSDGKEVFEEGLLFPPIFLRRAGVMEESIVTLIRANVRLPLQVLGDMQAQLIANEALSNGLNRLLSDGLVEDFAAFGEDIKALTEGAMRAAISAVPDGVYRYAVQLDGFDAPVSINVAVRIEGDQLEVDFTGSSPQVSRGINSMYCYTVGTAGFAVKALLEPKMPNNAGAFRAIRFVVPPKTVVNGSYPVATGGRSNSGHYTAIAVFGALSKAVPDRAMAESGNIWIVNLASLSGEERWGSTFILSSGMGARATSDGWSCRMFPQNAAGTSVEIIESNSPVWVRRKHFASGSGGEGEFRGGLGQEVEIQLTGKHEALITVMAEKVLHPTLGAFRGGNGRSGSVSINGEPVHGKKSYEIFPGDIITVRTPGGGGIGRPAERSKASLDRDRLLGLL